MSVPNLLAICPIVAETHFTKKQKYQLNGDAKEKLSKSPKIDRPQLSVQNNITIIVEVFQCRTKRWTD